MTRKGENVSFVVVGLVLAVVVIGGLYSLRQGSFLGLGGNESGDAVVANTDAEETATEDVTTDESAGQTEASTDDGSTSSTDEVVDTPVDELTATSSASDAATELPETGPADAILTALGPAMLTGAFVAYQRSRQS